MKLWSHADYLVWADVTSPAQRRADALLRQRVNDWLASLDRHD